MKVICENNVLAERVVVADSFISKFVGLMNKKSMDSSEGLLLVGCGSIHSMFMKIPIDAVYLSSDYEVLDMETIAPWRIGKLVKKTAHVLELSAGAAAGRLRRGEKLIILDA